jgi:hypothetical protein
MRTSPELLELLDWDTEAGTVSVYAEAEKDIRGVAEILNKLVPSR